LEGYLVLVEKLSAKKDKKWVWRSSTSNTDNGDGACEVFYVTGGRIISEMQAHNISPVNPLNNTAIASTSIASYENKN